MNWQLNFHIPRRSLGFDNFQEFSQPLDCLYQAMQTQEKDFDCFYKITLSPLRDGDVTTVLTYSVLTY